MFRNYLITAYRNIKRQKLYSFINIFGLAIGMACVILILLYIKHELSFDRFHKNADCIYRIVERHTRGDRTRYHSGTPAPLAQIIIDEFPEVINTVRIGGGDGHVIRYEDKEIRTNYYGGGSVDQNFFKVFDLPFTKGSPHTALSNVHSVVIIEELAQKVFGDEEPIGKILKIGQESYKNEYTVTGVIENPPSNSLFQYNYIISFNKNYRKGNEGNVGWEHGIIKQLFYCQKTIPQRSLKQSFLLSLKNILN